MTPTPSQAARAFRDDRSIETVPDVFLAYMMRGRRSIFRSNRRAAITACREMIRRREIRLGIAPETFQESLREFWREKDIQDFQVFA